MNDTFILWHYCFLKIFTATILVKAIIFYFNDYSTFLLISLYLVYFFLRESTSQSVVTGPAASASSVNLLEMHILKSHLGPTRSETPFQFLSQKFFVGVQEYKQ